MHHNCVFLNEAVMPPGVRPQGGGLSAACPPPPAILLTVSLMVATLVPASALGQPPRSSASDQRQRSSSHRELQLPMQREPNLAEQFRLLQQLRSMVDSPAAEPPPASGTRGLDPALLEAARKMFPEQSEMLERMRDSLSEEDLQRLREAWAGTPGAADPSPRTAPPGASPPTAEMLETLRQANPALGELLDDPRIRQRAEEMLREFQQKRQLPESNALGGGAGMLPSQPANPEAGTGPRTGTGGSARPAEPSTSEPPRDAADPASRGMGANSQRPGAGSGRSQPAMPTSPAARNALESAGGRESAGGSGPPGGASDTAANDRQPRSGQPEQRIPFSPRLPGGGYAPDSQGSERADRPGTADLNSRQSGGDSQPLSGSQELTRDRAEALLRELLPGWSGSSQGSNSQGDVPAPKGGADVRAGSPPTGVPEPRMRRPNDGPADTGAAVGGGIAAPEPSREKGSASRQDSASLPSTETGGPGTPGANGMKQFAAGDATPSNSPKPSLKDILERVDSDPSSLPPLTVPNSSIEYFKDWLSERGLKKAERSDLFDKLKGAIPDRVRADLKDRGLDETLSKIVDEARGGLGSGGDQESVNSIFGGAVGTESQGKSLRDRIAQLADREPGKADSNSSKSRSAAAANPKDEGGEKKKGPAEAINDFFKNLAPPSEDKPRAAASSAGPSTTTLPWGTLLPLALVLFLVGLVGWVYGSRRSAAAHNQDSSVLNNLQITSRADVVRAFHLLAHQQAGEVEAWWTHRRLAKSWAGQQPLVREQVEALTRLYEIARYRPDSADLSDAELRDARAAMERLRTC